MTRPSARLRLGSPTTPTRAACLLLYLVLVVALVDCLAVRPFDEARWRERTEGTRVEDLYAPNREASGQFVNPWLPQEKSGWDFWRWKLSRRDAVAEAAGVGVEPVPNDGRYLRDPGQPASLTHVGHATFVLQWGGPVIGTDPLFGPRAADARPDLSNRVVILPVGGRLLLDGGG